MKIVIDVKYSDTFTATSKAREDVNAILKKNGYKIKYIDIKPVKNNLDLFKNINYCYNQLKEILKNIPHNSVLIFQYPFDSMNYKFSLSIKDTCSKKKIKTIVLIHDLNSLRTSSKIGKIYYKYYIREFKFLNNFDYVICHNAKMKEYLQINNIKSEKLVSLELFDYLISNSKTENILAHDYKRVVIAGNLSKEKSGYVYKLNEMKFNNYLYNLYGINYINEIDSRIKYCGTFKSDKPNTHIYTGFGLVWDGISYNECSGYFGKYLQWNNPHKFSLYIACGIPVIVWSKSALSEFVTENKIGICVESLEELDEFFRKLTKKQYQEYCKNVSKIKNDVTKGNFLIHAIKKCLGDKSEKI